MTGENPTRLEKEFTDERGRGWTVRYAEGGGVKGLVTMREIVFRSEETERRPEERYLSVYPGYLERAAPEELRVALTQAQRVDTPW